MTFVIPLPSAPVTFYSNQINSYSSLIKQAGLAEIMVIEAEMVFMRFYEMLLQENKPFCNLPNSFLMFDSALDSIQNSTVNYVKVMRTNFSDMIRNMTTLDGIRETFVGLHTLLNPDKLKADLNMASTEALNSIIILLAEQSSWKLFEGCSDALKDTAEWNRKTMALKEKVESVKNIISDLVDITEKLKTKLLDAIQIIPGGREIVKGLRMFEQSGGSYSKASGMFKDIADRLSKSIPNWSSSSSDASTDSP